MTTKAGDRLLRLLQRFEAEARWTVLKSAAHDDSSEWRLEGSTWRAKVIVDGRRWLGLEFEATDPQTGRSITYDVDTDLYDISRDDQREFAHEIESDIVEFLENLAEGKVLRSRGTREIVLVFAKAGSYVRLAKGRWLTSGSTHAGRETALAGGAFEPVN